MKGVAAGPNDAGVFVRGREGMPGSAKDGGGEGEGEIRFCFFLENE